MFLLTQRSEEQLEFFKENEEIGCFSTPAELREKVKFYLNRNVVRKKMSEAGYLKVQSHTYLDRAKNVLNIYRDLGNKIE